MCVTKLGSHHMYYINDLLHGPNGPSPLFGVVQRMQHTLQHTATHPATYTAAHCNTRCKIRQSTIFVCVWRNLVVVICITPKSPPRVRISQIAHENTSDHTREYATSHMRTSHITEYVTSHVRISHFANENKLHRRIIHIAHENTSHRTWEQVTSQNTSHRTWE